MVNNELKKHIEIDDHVEDIYFLAQKIKDINKTVLNFLRLLNIKYKFKRN